MELIDRQAAIDALNNIKIPRNASWYQYYCKALTAMNRLPSAQPEIIRCNDCKHWLDIDDGRQKHRMCADVYGDWFCADAERRIDD